MTIQESPVQVNERRSRTRSIIASVLVVLSAVSLLAASVGYWVHFISLDTDAFMEIVEPSVTSDEFAALMSDRLSESVIEALDMESRLDERLSGFDQYLGTRLIEALDLTPEAAALLRRLDVPSLADLAQPIASSINQEIEDSIDSFVHSEEFVTVLLSRSRQAHETAIALMRGDLESLENVYVSGEEVKWNVIPLVRDSLEWVIEEGLLGGEEMALPDLSDNPIASAAIARFEASLDIQLPDDFGQVTVLTTSQLDTLQTAGRTFDRLVWLLIGTTVVLITATFGVSPTRRRTLVQVAVATVVVLFLTSLAIQRITTAIQESFLEPAAGRAFFVIADELMTSLRQIWIGLAVLAFLLGLVADFAGRPKWTKRSGGSGAGDRQQSHFGGFVGAHYDGLAIVALVVALLAIWAIGLSWFWTPIVLVILGGGLWYGQQQRARTEADEVESEFRDD